MLHALSWLRRAYKPVGVATCIVSSLAAGTACLGGRSAARKSASSARTTPARVASVAPAASADVSSVATGPIDQRKTAIRVRVSGLDPERPTQARWRLGGEGLGGSVRQGEFRAADDQGPLRADDWSLPRTLEDVLPPDTEHDGYLTLSAGESGRDRKQPASRNVGFEVEQLYDGRVIRSLRSVEPEGGTLTLFVPGVKTTGFVGELSTAAEVAAARRKWLLDNAGTPPRPLPHRFSIVSDLGGFGAGWGYGVRVTDPDVMRSELASLLQLGVTGLRTAPEFVLREGLPGVARFRARILGPIGYPTPDKRRDPTAAGCPFAAGAAGRAQQIAEAALAKARAENSDTVWTLTQDEIGAVTDLAPEGKAHMASCDRCRAGFVDWLKEQRVTPAEVGASSFSEVRPLPIWNNPDRPWLKSVGLRRRAYLTRQFLNVASARLFTPIRDQFSRANATPRAPGASGPAAVYSYALRGSTFLSNGSSLDFFEFYRHADNAVVWETSNRDARAWSWDSYLMDVQRVLAERLGLAEGIYVKPHRGAPIQRALSAAARGNSLIYWYTYGPDYWKGDSFSSDAGVLRLAQRAAQLLGAAEPSLFGARLAERPRVAIVKPETTLAWATLSAEPSLMVASLENAKWVYTALQHSHVPVDPLDERFLIELDLSRYAAIYVNGTHLNGKAAAALASYVKKGGVLVTNGAGLLRDEADEPLRSLDAVFGVRGRALPELRCPINTFRAVRLEPLSGCTELDRVQATFAAQPTSIVIGSERLEPLPTSDVLARYQDGSPAMIRHAYGKGRAFLIGTFAGLEYAAPNLRDGFDMHRDFDAARRSYLLEPIRSLLEDPVECSEPLVEPVLLKTATGDAFVVTLANWAYAAQDDQPDMTGNMHHVALQVAHDLRLVIHHLPTIRRVHSVALDRDVDFKQTSDGIELTLERLEEGDVLRLE